MFGDLGGDQEWGGKEELDSDVDMPEFPLARTPSSEPSPLEGVFKEPDIIPAVEEIRGNLGSEGSSVSESTPVPEHTPTSVATQSANVKLKDLFAPQEEQGGFPVTKYL
jgi:hypothetical protein